MVGYTSVETKQDEIYWYEGVGSLSLNCSLVCDFVLCTFLFYVIKEIPKESGGLYIYIAVQYKGEWLEHVLCRVLVYYHCEWYFDYPLSPYHAQLWKDFFMLFYHGDTIGVHYKEQVDNMISVVIYNNHCWNLMLRDNVNYVLGYLH